MTAPGGLTDVEVGGHGEVVREGGEAEARQRLPDRKRRPLVRRRPLVDVVPCTDNTQSLPANFSSEKASLPWIHSHFSAKACGDCCPTVWGQK